MHLPAGPRRPGLFFCADHADTAQARKTRSLRMGAGVRFVIIGKDDRSGVCRAADDRAQTPFLLRCSGTTIVPAESADSLRKPAFFHTQMDGSVVLYVVLILSLGK